MVSVHIRLTGWIHRCGRKISIERLTRNIGEGSPELRASSPVVAKSTLVDLPVTIKSGGVENGWSCPLRRSGLRLYLGDMSLSGPMTNFAGDAQHKAVSIVEIGLRIGGERMNVTGMALYATGVRGTSEVGRAVLVAGAIDPLMTIGPVAHG